VLYHTNVVGNGKVQVIRMSDGQSAAPPIPLTSTLRQTSLVSVGRGRWRPDGRAIVFVGADENGDSCLFEQPFVPGKDTSAMRRLLQRSEAGLTIESFGISPDGKHVTISIIEDQYALMRLDGLAGITRSPRR
jgi:Tol biopolymer transport system component